MVKKHHVFEVTAKSSLEQAANLLFRAEEKADYNNDTDSLMKIAAGWMELHEYLSGRPDESKKHPLGFTGGLRGIADDGEYEEGELADAVADDPTSDSAESSEGGVEVRSQSWQF